MKNLLFRTGGTWVFLLFLMFSCSDSLEERIIEEETFEAHLSEKSVTQKELTSEKDDLKKKGSKNGKDDDSDEDDSEEDDSDNNDSDDNDSEEKENNGKSEENKGKGKDKDSDDDDSDEDDSDEDDSDEDDSDEDDSDEDDSDEDDSNVDDSDEKENNGKSEENKGKGKDNGTDNDDSDEDDSEEKQNNGKSEENKGKGKDKDSDGSSDDKDSDDDFEEEMSADFRTQTIGGWGSNPKGNNPGAYLHDNFDTVFPNGLTIGSDDLTVLFTSAQAITNFLPSGSKSKILTESYVDPTKRDLKNNLVSQLLAATLSVEFDKAIADFSKSEEAISRLAISEGELSGLIVSQVLEEANLVLTGKDSDYSMDQIHEALTNINESFVDGKSETGYLTSNL